MRSFHIFNKELFKTWLFDRWKEKDTKINNYEKYQYNDFNYMNKDPDLENLRKDERYQILVKRTAKSKNFK